MTTSLNFPLDCVGGRRRRPWATGARLAGATLGGVSAVECEFEGADFTGARFGTADATRATDAAAAFCRRFGIAIDRSGRYTNDEAGAAHLWGGPCDFTGSTGLPNHLARIDPTGRRGWSLT